MHERFPVSVPADLRARMEALAEVVDWSAVACRAFEEKLASLTLGRKKRWTRAAIVERLRGTLPPERPYDQGYRAGRDWATRLARVEELRRLAEARDRCDGDWTTLFEGASWHPFGMAIAFATWVRGVDEPDEDALAFWRDTIRAGDDQVADADFVRGFAEGALDLWAEVEPLL